MSDAIKGCIPDEASTIHRALGVSLDGPHRLRHHAGDPLHADVVVVDECSMIDLALARRLADAVPPGARLVLLGDPYQLASVEAGAVLSELCGAAIGGSRFSAATADRIERLASVALPASARAAGGRPANAIDDAVVRLTRSYRFEVVGGIGTLARAIHRGDPDAALAVLDEGRPDARLFARDPAAPLDGDPLLAAIVEGYAGYLRARDPVEALAKLSAFRVLCAHRRGPAGVETLNRQIERALVARRLLRAGATHYHGRPVMVTHNDYGVGLFNGDVGVILRDPDAGGALRAFFPGASPDAPPRTLAPARLPPHETVFAMTIHKSQGSEFDRVAVVLPAPDSPLLTRELIYTAVTRAKKAVSLHGAPAAVREGVRREVERASGLSDALRGG